MLTATPEAESQRLALDRLREAGKQPVSAASTAVFRISFGLLVAFSSLRFLAKGWVGTLYVQPEHHLTYRWFEWVEPLPAPFMHLHMIGLAGLGVAIALGYRFRLALGLFLIGFAYTELIDAALYLNHYWFVTMAGVLLLLLPVQHHWSLDARSGRVPQASSVPVAVVWALRSQLAVVYLFAGIAKLNGDWLLRAQPMQLWLADRADTPIIGSVFGLAGVPHVMSWAGAIFDCTIVAFLLWRRTRPLAYVTLVGFHLLTGLLFQIGVFPIVMILSTLIFFDPDWVHRFTRRATPAPLVTAPATGRIRIGLLIAFAATQIWLPLRHYAEPSNVRWSEEGYYLSWRVMLTEKAGFVEYQVTDPDTGDSWTVDPSLVLADWQRSSASTKPDLIHATALLIADHYAHHDADLDAIEVRATAWVTMNGRPATLIVDPSVDLAAHKRGEVPSGWILPG